MEVVGFAQIIRRGWVVNTLFSCISAFTCLQHHGERFHNIVTTGENLRKIKDNTNKLKEKAKDKLKVQRNLHFVRI